MDTPTMCQRFIFFVFVCISTLVVLTYGACPEACTCDADVQGRKRVHCFRGGLDNMYTSDMDTDIKVLVVTAPPENPNNLTIGRIFIRLTQLQEIHITDSFVPAVGDNTFWDTNNLRVLNLTRNKIRNIKDTNFKGLDNLEKLHLDNNEIMEVPSAVFHYMPKLRNLTLARNKLTKLVPRMFLNVLQLTHLDLSWNPISEIDTDVFKELTHLHRLYLGHCELTKFESVMARSMPDLEVLDLSHNLIQFVGPTEFESLHKLKFLYLHANRLNTILEDTFSGHNLTVLTLSRNNIRRLQQEAFSNLTVRGLDLSYNRLDISDPDFLRPVTEKLVKLDISGNRIRWEDLSELMDTFPIIKDLSVASLSLTDLDPKHLQFPKTLRKLNVSHNALTGFSNELLTPLKSLEVLDLSDNQFLGLDKSLIETFDSMQHLQMPYLHGNPWSCDLCYIPALLAWLNDSKHFVHACDILHRSSCLKCHSPSNLTGRAIQRLHEDELEACDRSNIPALKVAGPESHLGIIIACSVIVILLVTITIVLVLYYRRGADYYTHEGERDDEGIYENPGVDEENGDLLSGRKPTIATIENMDEFKDDMKYTQRSNIVC